MTPEPDYEPVPPMEASEQEILDAADKEARWDWNTSGW